MTGKEKKVVVLNFKKDYRFLFSPSAKQAEMVKVPPLRYLMVDGQGDPDSAKDFSEKIQLLYGLAYTIKFMLKRDRENPFDFTVPPLSGLWCTADVAAFHDSNRRREWQWTLLILQPDLVDEILFRKACQQLQEKKNPPFLNQTRLQKYDEGLCAQIMHIGPYSQEGPTIAKLHRFFQEQGYEFNGLHHEIYLGDPRRGQPEKLRTILRQPIRARAS